ncbi:Nucleosome assembly protein 1-like 1 [Aphelenchoides bicaudatus]|nr:Nucleosome assembly protein 1-like 1 [Aphelenchoides bicaudatus]
MSLNALLANHEDVTNDLIPDYIKHAPESVRRRLRALKKLQLKTVEIQADFYKKVHELETEFRSKFDAVNVQREKIVSGDYEPAENELDDKLFTWMEPEHVQKFNEDIPAGDGKSVNGVPDFWLNTLKNVPGVGDQIAEHDEAILKYLTDITVEQQNEPPVFTLKFHFAENPYFVNQTLTKFYRLSIGPNEFEVKHLYDGPSIVETKGCEINWKEGKNVTEKTIKKKAKKGANAGKSTTKVVPNDSFFNFFKPEATQVEKEMPDEVAEMLNADFEAGQLIRDTVIDGAILYYTGESAEDEDFDFGGIEDEDGLGDSDEENEE